MDLDLHEDQLAALRLATGDRRICVITGCPGTGKTTGVRAIVDELERRGLAVALAAPTGKAALRLSQQTGRSASTIHRLLEPLPAGDGTFRFTRTAENPIEADVLILDEVSMVDVRLAARVLDALPRGVRLVLVGDQHQLPAVGPGAVLADVIASGVVPAVELSTIKRQRPGAIILACHAIKGGRVPDIANASGDDLFLDERSSPEEVAAAVLELVQNRLPAALPKLLPEHFGRGVDPFRDIQVITPMRERGKLSCAALNALLQDAMNPAFGGATGPRIRPGDKVIQTKNDYSRGIMNGDVGFVREVLEGSGRRRMLLVAFEAADPFVARERLVEIPATDNHLELAYAVTCHKFQGSEAKVVVIPIHCSAPPMLLTRAWIYTAISRAKHFCVLVGERTALARAVGRVSPIRRTTSLASMLRERVAPRLARHLHTPATTTRGAL